VREGRRRGREDERKRLKWKASEGGKGREEKGEREGEGQGGEEGGGGTWVSLKNTNSSNGPLFPGWTSSGGREEREGEGEGAVCSFPSFMVRA
jgi:hypothetical protein